MYNSMAESSTIQVGLYQKIAELIGNDFSKKWFIDDGKCTYFYGSR